MAEPTSDGKPVSERLSTGSLPILYTDQAWHPVDQAAIARGFAETSGAEGIIRFLPDHVLSALGQTREVPHEKPINVSADDFVQQMRTLGERYVHPNIPTYFGKSTQLCMNLTAIMTNYLADVYHFPVVGLYDSSDSQHEFYIRPTTAIFDRVPQYEEFARPIRYSLEDMIEVKIGDRIFAVDFNFWYGDDRRNGMLVEEITTLEQRKRLGQEFGLWTTEFEGLDTTDEFALAAYMRAKDGDTEAANYYLHDERPTYFNMTVGEPQTMERFYHEVVPGNPDYFDERWHSFQYSAPHITTREYIKTVSTAALISQGHQPNELMGFGRLYLIPMGFQQRRLLSHLPTPESAITDLSYTKPQSSTNERRSPTDN